MATLKLSTCFICGEGGGGVVLPKSRGQKRKKMLSCSNFVSLNETHGILLKLMLSIRRNASIFGSDELFVQLQRVGTLISPNPIQFCERCDQLARNVRELYLELEVVQMKIVDELKRARELVVGQRNLEAINDGITREQSDQENDGFRNIVGRFQSFVKENDVNAERIPLVYLGSRLPKLIPAQQMNLQAQGVMANGEDSLIKQEIADVDNHADDAYDTPEEIFDKNDDCNVKLEPPNEIRVRTAGCSRKRRLSARPPPIKTESIPVTGRRSATMRASTLIGIATRTRQPPRCPKRSKIRTEAQLLAHKIQAEKKKIRAEKRKLGILRPRQGCPREREKECCESCGFEVVSLYSIEQHLRSHEDADEEKPFECPDCKQRFVQRQYFEYHLTLHTKVRRIKCEICAELVSRVDLKKHHLTLHGKAYPCEYCTHCFGSVISLALHCSNHSTSNMTCEQCSPPKVIQGNKAFLRHLAEVHDHKDLLIPCEYPNCTEKYMLAERALHLGTTHKGPFVCQHCGKNFATIANRNKHIMCFHEKDLCTQVCDVCGERFPQKWQLESHQVSKHNFPSKFKCAICPGKYFARKTCLVKHNLSNHTPESEWPFSCTIEGCRKRCITKEALATHLQHHGSERLFKCDVCGHSSKSKKSLRSHARVHTDVRKHACPHCGRRFKEKLHLTEHIRLHTDERPFLCAVCGASYKQMGQLYHHKKKHKSDDTSFPSPRQTKRTSGESGSGLTPSKGTVEEQDISQQ